MSLKTVIVNEGCSAKCVHCPHGKKRSMMRTNASREIATAYEDVILLSGGEPLELRHQELQQLVLKCVENKKIFRIATGGHVPLMSITKQLCQIPYFSGFSMGTDVVLIERNPRCSEYQQVWKENIEFLKALEVNFSLTVSLSKDVGVFNELPRLTQLAPDFFMINSVDKAGTSQAEHSKSYIEKMGYEVVYGYLA